MTAKLEIKHFPQTPCKAAQNFCSAVSHLSELDSITPEQRSRLASIMENMVWVIWNEKRDMLKAWYSPEGLLRPIKEVRTNVIDGEWLVVVAERFAMTINKIFEPRIIN